MSSKPKYSLKQKLYQIIVSETEIETCECCGHTTMKPKTFGFRNCTPIIYITIYRHKTTYTTTFGTADENEINLEHGMWFTTPELAQAECDRRNQGGETK